VKPYGPPRLRHRLFLSFLVFAALPSLVLVYVSYRTLEASLALWQTPSVSRALEGSVQVARRFLVDRHPVLLRQLDSLLAASPPAPAPEPRQLQGGPFDAVGWSRLGRGHRIVWVARRGGLPIEPVVEKRLQGVQTDSLLVAGQEHLALVRLKGGVRWTALAPLPEEVRGPLADILEARAFYDELDDYRKVFHTSIALAALGLLVLVILLAWVGASLLALRVTRPLESLAEAMDALSRGQSGPPLVRGDSEVAELARAFERMRADLERSRRELARAERTAAWREVARRIAHEIKNPLTPIRLAVHRLRGLEERLAGEDRARLGESLLAVDQEVETLRRMADTFSRFSKLPEPDRKPAHLAPLVKSVAAMYEGTPAVLTWSAGEELGAVADEGQLRQALHNLIQNALDATGGVGPVAVTADAEARAGRPGVRLAVTDGGPGFGAEALARAGEPYFTEKTRGTGLGLAMVRRIAEGHGGSMALSNAPPGGARVEIWIPAEPPAEEITR